MTENGRFERELASAFGDRATTACPGEAALVAFYRGELSEADSESLRDHLGSCAACVALARDARAFVGAMQGVATEARVMPTSQAYRWLAAAAVLAAFTIAALWVARHRPAPRPVAEPSGGSPVAQASKLWKDRPITAAPYVPSPEDELVFRSAAPPSDFGEAMAPYIRGEYAAAEAALARYASAHPGDGRAPFYRGVALLLLGRDAEAMASLESAAAARPAPEGADWYLALARLRSGDVEGARRDLDAVAAAPGRYRLDAERLAGEIRASARR